MPEEHAFTGKKKCAACGLELHPLAHSCRQCGGGTSLMNVFPPKEMADIYRIQGEARELVEQSTEHIESGNLAKAIEVLKRAQEINPHNATACGNLGGVHMMQANYPAAIAEYERALQINPTLEGVPEALQHAQQAAKGGATSGCMLMACAVASSCCACVVTLWCVLF